MLKTIPILMLASLFGGAERSPRSHPSSLHCDGPDVDPWVTAFRDRVMSYDELAHFAVESFGPPTSCEGDVTSEFDGAKYGVVVLAFSGGATLEVRTQPPESSIMTLRSPGGFVDESSLQALLRQYSARMGLSIDWSTPEITSADGETTHTFWDQDPGLNASASLILRNERLVGVRIALAL